MLGWEGRRAAAKILHKSKTNCNYTDSVHSPTAELPGAFHHLEYSTLSDAAAHNNRSCLLGYEAALAFGIDLCSSRVGVVDYAVTLCSRSCGSKESNWAPFMIFMGAKWKDKFG